METTLKKKTTFAATGALLGAMTLTCIGCDSGTVITSDEKTERERKGKIAVSFSNDPMHAGLKELENEINDLAREAGINESERQSVIDEATSIYKIAYTEHIKSPIYAPRYNNETELKQGAHVYAMASARSVSQYQNLKNAVQLRSLYPSYR